MSRRIEDIFVIGWALLFAFTVFLCVAGAQDIEKRSQECSALGGVLVESASSRYVCVSGVNVK